LAVPPSSRKELADPDESTVLRPMTRGDRFAVRCRKRVWVGYGLGVVAGLGVVWAVKTWRFRPPSSQASDDRRPLGGVAACLVRRRSGRAEVGTLGV
jgi:hypothetical protein